MNDILKKNHKRGFAWPLPIVFSWLGPIVAGAVLYVLIPWTFSNYNNVRSLREARLTRAIKFGERNSEFNNKMSELMSLMPTFDSHAHRMKLSGIELKEAHRELNKNHLELSLEMSWIYLWPRDVQHEAEAQALLTPDELKQLGKLVGDYETSLGATLKAPDCLWHFVDSANYKVDAKSQNEIKKLKAGMDKKYNAESDNRTRLVGEIFALFANSKCRTSWVNTLGF